MANRRDLILVSGGRVAAALMALATIHAITSHLTPLQYGELALLMSVQMFCGLFLVNPVGQHINLNTHKWWDDGTLVPRLTWYGGYVLTVSVVGGLAALLVNNDSPTGKLIWTVAAVFFVVAAGTWNATLIPMLNMLGFRGSAVAWSIASVLVGLASSIVMTEWNRSASAWLMGQAAGLAVGAVGAGLALKKHAAPHKSTEVLALLDKKTLVAYCLPLCVATGLMWMQNSGYRFLVQHHWGLFQLGFLAIGVYVAAQVWSLAEQLAVQFLYPLFYRAVNLARDETDIGSAFSDLLNTLVPVYLIFTGALVVCAEYILKVLVAPQYHGAIVFVIIGGFIEFLRVVGNLLGNAAHVKRKTVLLALPYGAGAAVSFVLIYLAASYGLEILWAGVALIVGGLVTLSVMWLGMRQHLRFSVDVQRWLVALMAMSLIASARYLLPGAPTFIMSLIVLAGAGLIASTIAFGLLWRNPALGRLLNIELRTKTW